MSRIGNITPHQHLGLVNPPDWLTGAKEGDVVETAPGKHFVLVSVPREAVADERARRHAEANKKDDQIVVRGKDGAWVAVASPPAEPPPEPVAEPEVAS